MNTNLKVTESEINETKPQSIRSLFLEPSAKQPFKLFGQNNQDNRDDQDNRDTKTSEKSLNLKFSRFGGDDNLDKSEHIPIEQDESITSKDKEKRDKLTTPIQNLACRFMRTLSEEEIIDKWKKTRKEKRQDFK